MPVSRLRSAYSATNQSLNQMIRTASRQDLPAIDDIYNQAIEQGFRTAHTTPLTKSERERWFRNHTPGMYPIYVYQKGKQILGWASLSPYRSGREALSEVAEISFYVDYRTHGQGIGSALVEHCIQRAPELNKRVLFAIVIEGNRASRFLLEKFGFEQWGYLPEAVRARNEIRGQLYLGKILNNR